MNIIRSIKEYSNRNNHFVLFLFSARSRIDIFNNYNNNNSNFFDLSETSWTVTEKKNDCYYYFLLFTIKICTDMVHRWTEKHYDSNISGYLFKRIVVLRTQNLFLLH